MAAAAGTLPAFVPARFAPAIARAAQRWSVSGALLAAQLYEESHFNPFAQSAAGALGIAQFMPATAAGYGLADPFDADRAIDAQAHLMRDLLRAFGVGPARARRLQRRPRRRSARAAASRRSPRPSPTSPTSSACCTAPATRPATARAALEVRLVR